MDEYNIGVFAGGFNLLHAGHLEALNYADKQCDYLLVVVVRDQSLSGHKMYQEPIEDRFMKLKALRYVDEVMPCESEESLLELLKLLDYQTYFLSEEYKDKHWDGTQIVGEKMHYIPRKHNWSTTTEVQKIEQQLLEKNKSTNIHPERNSYAVGGIVRQDQGPILVGGDRVCYSPGWGEGVPETSSNTSLQIQLPEDSRVLCERITEHTKAHGEFSSSNN